MGEILGEGFSDEISGGSGEVSPLGESFGSEYGSEVGSSGEMSGVELEG